MTLPATTINARMRNGSQLNSVHACAENPTAFRGCLAGENVASFRHEKVQGKYLGPASRSAPICEAACLQDGFGGILIARSSGKMGLSVVSVVSVACALVLGLVL
jgi:hypothetical protein